MERAFVAMSAIAGLCALEPVNVGAEPSAEDPSGSAGRLFALSLEELMNTDVRIGSVTGSKLLQTPVSVTTITREMIDTTPARNVADLIEIYVPGALWLAHLAPRIGLRGLIVDRNYKLLLLVNGQNVNQKMAQGATRELQNWDLNDIERIEVVRGPGSVTYGPGAIAAVINIITRTAATAPGTAVGTEYVGRYDSVGGYGSTGYTGRDYELYAYGSWRRTDGLDDPRYFEIDRVTGVTRYLGSGDRGSPYLGDALGAEQKKLQLDARILGEWRLWGRYTSAGTPSTLEWKRRATAAGRAVYERFTGEESQTLVLENQHAFSDSLALDSRLALDSEYYYDYLATDRSKRYDQDGFHGVPPGNVVYDFRETEITAGTLLRLDFSERHRLAFGFDYTQERYDKGELDRMYINLKDFKTNQGASMQELASDGFNANMQSLLGEGRFELHPLATVLLSGRLDRHEFSDLLFSPRVALSSQFNTRNNTTLSWQQSARMCTIEEAFKDHLNGRSADTETLRGYELQHVYMPTANCTLSAAAFYDSIDALGWLTDHSGPVGTLQVAGLEAEARCQAEAGTLGLSHACTKQLDWDSADPRAVQGISVADYDVNGLTDTGNDLSNWANHATKVFATFPVVRRLTVHVDTQVFWRWEGNREVEAMYARKYAGAGDAAWGAVERRLRDESFGGTDVRLNAALAWRLPLPIDSTLTVYALNLMGTRRYLYSSGDSADYPAKIGWIEEPSVAGIKADVRF